MPALGVFKAAQFAPGIEKVVSLGVGVGVGGIGASLKILPVRVLNSAFRVPSNRFKNYIAHGFEQHDLETLNEIREEVRAIQDKELAKRTSFQLITREDCMEAVNAHLWAAIGPHRLRTPEEQYAAGEVAADHAVKWLLAYYGLKPKKHHDSDAEPQPAQPQDNI
jgi:hypothetical protein